MILGIKAEHKTVNDTYRMLKRKGLSDKEAEEEIKHKLHILRLPDNIKERIKEE